MPFDGNGIYNPLSPPIFPAVSGTTITANQYNQQILDMGSALSNCITRDGQSPPTTDIPMNNHKLTGLLAPTLGGDAANKTYVDGQVSAGDTTVLNAAKQLVGFSAVRGLTGGGTTATAIQLTFTKVRLINAANEVTVVAGGTYTCDLATAGPVLGGRDQAGNFNTVWVYVYAIWNGTTLGLIASTNATAPAMPSGYTWYALLTPVRVGGVNNNFVAFFVRGHSVRYVTSSSLLISTNISAGGSYGLPNYSVYIPPICTTWQVRAVFGGGATAGGAWFLLAYLQTGAAGTTTLTTAGGNQSGSASGSVRQIYLASGIPYLSSAPQWNIDAGSQWSSAGLDCYVEGFEFENGAF